MRLDKFIATASGYSRSQVKRLVKTGRVAINGKISSDPGMIIDATRDTISLDQKAISLPSPRYFMLHKPAGVVCSNQDSEHPTVLDLLYENKKDTLQIAGRLDMDTTGLVLITDNGDWNHRITSPKKHCAKVYQLTVKHPLKEDLVDTFVKGIQLKGEKKPTRPATLKILDKHKAELAIEEGKYHQVKRMFAACGNRVESLHRSRVGAITLDSSLKPGDYRPLTDNEIKLETDLG